MKINSQKKAKVADIKVLLILNKTQSNNLRILVRLHKKWLQDRVGALLEEAKDKEAFNLICSKAEVDSYIPPGQKLKKRPALTFVEDML